jgi:hypothetical protein
MAGRNNPLISLLGMSFDQFNLLHRWLGRIVVLEALAHTVAHLAKNTVTKGATVAWSSIFTSPFLLAGFVVS